MLQRIFGAVVQRNRLPRPHGADAAGEPGGGDGTFEVGERGPEDAVVGVVDGHRAARAQPPDEVGPAGTVQVSPET